MVNIIFWNPKRSIFRGRITSRIPIRRKINNFGDLIGPIIVMRILEESGIRNDQDSRRCVSTPNLLTVGSILHLANNHDIVWGSGRNGKIKDEFHRFKQLSVRALRGPLTKEFLEKKSIHCPEIFGDPALLLPLFFPDFVKLTEDPLHDFTIIPNLNDLDYYRTDENIINPTSDMFSIIERIARSRFVVGSSLHAIIIAESFGIPARLIESESEDSFKYEDYYLGTGRTTFTAASTVSSALDMGGEPGLRWNPVPLLDSFPYDLWRNSLDQDES